MQSQLCCTLGVVHVQAEAHKTLVISTTYTSLY